MKTAKKPKLSRTSLTPVINDNPITPITVDAAQTPEGFPVPTIHPRTPAKNGAVANAPRVPIATPIRAAPIKNEIW